MVRNLVRIWRRPTTGAAALAAAADDTLMVSLCDGQLNEKVPAASTQNICPCPGWKRLMDVIGASLALVALLPLLFAVAALIKCTSRGPVLFRQQRYGLDGKPFLLWKFRTIQSGEASARHHCYVTGLMENDAPLKKLDDELALVWGGALLRKLGLDELPQLINVLKGEMSLVGPRPDVLPMESYQAWQKDRFQALPGITGLWQVSGKNETTFSTMIRLDIAYIRERSPWLDMVIMLRTIPAVLWG
jgi:lipopolysaccharide/colanic/teichoic acid biosynthesis glycosyltransferase